MCFKFLIGRVYLHFCLQILRTLNCCRVIINVSVLKSVSECSVMGSQQRPSQNDVNSTYLYRIKCAYFSQFDIFANIIMTEIKCAL